MSLKIKKNDLVKVLAGRDRGKQGKVTQVFPALDLAVVEGVNLRFKHLRTGQAGKTGNRVQFAAPLKLSKLAIVCPQCGKNCRPRFKINDEGIKSRTCHKCGGVL
ncbi:MAG: 50S ribosomal protein L24 [Patescibacteria group bacterium]